MIKRIIGAFMIITCVLLLIAYYTYKEQNTVDTSSIDNILSRYHVSKMTETMLRNEMGISSIKDIRIEDLGEEYRFYYGFAGFNIKKKDIHNDMVEQKLGELNIYLKKMKNGKTKIMYGDKPIKVILPSKQKEQK